MQANSLDVNSDRPRLATEVPGLLLAGLVFGYVAVRAARLAMTYDESTTYFCSLALVRDILAYVSPCATANNHLLYTLLVKASATAFGSSELALRLPSVLAFAVYLGAVLHLTRGTPVAVRLSSIIVLVAHPFMLDFFSLARGYSLALALQMVSLAALRVWTERDHSTFSSSLAFVSAALATLANFAFLNFYVGLFVGVGASLLFISLGTSTPPQLLRLCRITTLVAMLGALLPLALVVPPLLQLRASQELFFGGTISFWTDSILSLCRTLLYGVVAPRWFPGWMVAAAILVLVSFLFTSLAHLVVAETGAGAVSRSQFPVLVLVILSVTALVNILQHHLLGSRYLAERTALIYLPPFLLVLTLHLAAWARSRSALVHAGALALLIGLAALCSVHTARTAQLDSVHTWQYEADSRRLVTALEKIHAGAATAEQARQLVLRVTRSDAQSISFYRHVRQLDWLTLRSGLGGPDEFDFLYAGPYEEEILRRRDLRPVHTFRSTRSVLLVRVSSPWAGQIDRAASE
ncbi:MAG: hypothetical protein ABIJ09_13125 [Pseudomonadota bacterium]